MLCFRIDAVQDVSGLCRVSLSSFVVLHNICCLYEGVNESGIVRIASGECLFMFGRGSESLV